MRIELTAWNTRKIIMSGDFISYKHAIEYAIDHNINLDYLTLNDVDLSHSNLDGVSLNYAQLTRVNFEGANISESSVIKAKFEDCNLTNVTLTDTNCVGTSFQNCVMMNIEALYADFRGALVTCPHFLKNDFRQTAHFGGACFMNKGNMCPMSKGPVLIRGLGLDVVLLDEHAIVSGTIILRKEQLFDKQGQISPIFARSGINPSPEVLQKLWHCIRPCSGELKDVA